MKCEVGWFFRFFCSYVLEFLWSWVDIFLGKGWVKVCYFEGYYYLLVKLICKNELFWSREVERFIVW